MRGSSFNSVMGNDFGQAAGTVSRFGAATGSAGAGRLRHAFQKGVKTWNGLPCCVASSVGSNSRLPLKLWTVIPLLLRTDLISVSRLIVIGS